MQISDLSTPAALIERSTMEANAKAMAQRAHRLAVRLRPHVKTHKAWRSRDCRWKTTLVESQSQRRLSFWSSGLS